MKLTERILSLASLVFGAVAAFASVSTLFATLMQLGQIRRALRGGARVPLAQFETQLAPSLLVLWGTMLLLGAALVVVGVGLYREAAWARAAAFRWSISALAFIPVQFWLQLGVIAPRTQAMLLSLDQEHVDPAALPNTPGEWAWVIARHLLVFAPLPVMLLIFARRKERARALLEPSHKLA